MKIRKRANQKNFRVREVYYTEWDYRNLCKIEGIELLMNKIVVYAEYATDVKVILDDYGFYTTVAVMKTGEEIYIEL